LKANKDSKPDWYGKLSKPPFQTPIWNDRKKEMLTIELQRSQGNGSGKAQRRRYLRASAASMVFALIVMAAGWLIWQQGSIVPTKGTKPSWDVHSGYNLKGILQWEVFPGGELQAGKPAGAMWIINKPLEDLESSKIRIIATHQETGLTLEELPETEIEDTDNYRISSSAGAPAQTRIVSKMAIPLGGKWRFEMFLDGLPSGDVVLYVPDGDWEPSPSFSSGAYNMTGTDGKLGLINAGFVVGQENKYMWHFWGTADELTGDFQIYEMKESTSELIKGFEGKLQPVPLNGADASHPSHLVLPSAGKWKLIVMINNQWFGSIVVVAREPSG